MPATSAGGSSGVSGGFSVYVENLSKRPLGAAQRLTYRGLLSIVKKVEKYRLDLEGRQRPIRVRERITFPLEIL